MWLLCSTFCMHMYAIPLCSRFSLIMLPMIPNILAKPSHCNLQLNHTSKLVEEILTLSFAYVWLLLLLASLVYWEYTQYIELWISNEGLTILPFTCSVMMSLLLDCRLLLLLALQLLLAWSLLPWYSHFCPHTTIQISHSHFLFCGIMAFQRHYFLCNNV